MSHGSYHNDIGATTASTAMSIIEAELLLREYNVRELLPGLDRGLRRDYEAAMATEPELVEKETNIRAFLTHTGYDPMMAATKICAYWKFRRHVFGEDHWLKPMVLTGTGALSSHDVEIIRTGFLAIFPRRSTGGWTYLMDLSRLPCDSGPTLARFMLYFWTHYGQLSQYSKPPTTIQVVTSSPPPPIEPQKENMWKHLKAALPFSIPKTFVCQAYETSAQKALIDFLGYRALRWTQTRWKLPTIHVAGDSQSTTQHALRDTGLESSLLPHSLGGDFSYSQFDDWIRRRLSNEGAMSAAPLRLMSQPDVSSASRRRDEASSGDGTEPQRDRDLRALRKRAAYNQNKAQVDHLQSIYRTLGMRNNELRQEGARLEAILHQAHAIVALHERCGNSIGLSTPRKFG